MDESPTQACTLDSSFTDEQDNLNKQQGWAVLKSLNPLYPHYTLEKDEIVMGRQSNSTIHFNDLNVSGKHCVIKKEGGLGPIIAFLYDHSTNGTYVDGIKVGKGQRCLLSSGQEISLVQSKKQGQEKIAFIYQPCEKEDEEEGGPQLKYHLGDVLGNGNFATVKLAVDRKTGAKYAIKIIDKKKYFMNSSSRKDALMDEVKILESLNHNNIIHIQEVFNTEKTLYLVLELVEGGELLNDILCDENGYYKEEKAKSLFKQIVNAVKYLHDQGIAHRDLKPENILLKSKKVDLSDTNSIKLSDFGLSRTISEGSFMKTMCGTPQYLAPEILNGSNGAGGYGKEVDCWSMGGILYVMLCGYPPFSETREISIFEQIRNADFDFPEEDWSGVSEEAKDLIKRLLNVNPSQRYNCEDIFNHPWYNNNISLKALLQKESSVDNTRVLGKRKSEENIKPQDVNGDQSKNATTTTTNHINGDDNDSTTNGNHTLKKSKSNIQSTVQSSSPPSSSSSSILITPPQTSSSTTTSEDDDTDEENEQVYDLKPISPIKQKSNIQRSNSSTNSSSSTPPQSSLANNNNNNNDNDDNSSSPSSNVNPSNSTIHHHNNNNNNSSISSNNGNNHNNNNVFLVPAPKQASPSLTSTAAATTTGNNLPPCMYGSKCYRKNKNHFKEYSHPPGHPSNSN